MILGNEFYEYKRLKDDESQFTDCDLSVYSILKMLSTKNVPFTAKGDDKFYENASEPNTELKIGDNIKLYQFDWNCFDLIKIIGLEFIDATTALVITDYGSVVFDTSKPRFASPFYPSENAYDGNKKQKRQMCMVDFSRNFIRFDE